MPLDGHLGRALRQGPAGQRPPEEVLRSHGLARPGSVVEIQLQHLVGAAVEGEEALLIARAHDPQYTHLRSLRRPTGAHRLADPQARIENHGSGGVITRLQAGVAGLLPRRQPLIGDDNLEQPLSLEFRKVDEIASCAAHHGGGSSRAKGFRGMRPSAASQLKQPLTVESR